MATVAAAILLAAAFITDLRKQIIPNWLNLFFSGAGLLYHLAAGGWAGGLSAFEGMASGAGPLLLLYLFRGIGAGDVKLFGALGVWVGVIPVLQVLLYSILYAGLIGIVFVIVNKPLAKRMVTGAIALVVPGMNMSRQGWMAWASGGRTFPFMLAVLPGALTAWLYV
ncbi:A24 family peptidase [Paenibacillus protaetiae]|nr:A24 family peptidase [Paenibacillus protaetiae]